jgi:hypothetical protein
MKAHSLDVARTFRSQAEAASVAGRPGTSASHFHASNRDGFVAARLQLWQLLQQQQLRLRPLLLLRSLLKQLRETRQWRCRPSFLQWAHSAS